MKQVETRTGKIITLLNPSEKGKKFANEMRWGARITNDGVFKEDKDGNYVPLSREAMAYRAGYLAHSKDSANAYNAKHGIKKKNKRK